MSTVLDPNASNKEASLALVKALEDAGAITSTALMLSDPEMEYEQYDALCFFFGRLNRSCAFWTGDLILYGENLFGHYAFQAAEATGLAPQTLANRASVCRHIPPNRRRASLPFGVHAEVAYLEPAERDRWLDRAELGAWTRAKLRLEMQRARGLESGLVDDLIETSKIDADIEDGSGMASSSIVAREEHHESVVPAANGDFLGELVPAPIDIEVAATRIVTALAWAPEELRRFVVDYLQPYIQPKVRDLLADDHY